MPRHKLSLVFSCFYALLTTNGPFLHPHPPPRGKEESNKDLTHRKRGYLKEFFFLQLIHKIIISTSKLALFFFTWTWCKRVDIRAPSIYPICLRSTREVILCFYKGRQAAPIHILGPNKSYCLALPTFFQNKSLQAFRQVACRAL